MFGLPQTISIYPAYYIVNSLMILLLFLHLIWTYYIVLVFYRIILVGQVILLNCAFIILTERIISMQFAI